VPAPCYVTRPTPIKAVLFPTLTPVESLHRALLREQPVRPVSGCSEVLAHQAVDVLDLWQRWEERSGKRQEPPFWAAVWPGAALLGRVLIDGPELVRGRTVFDVGCGAGTVAIAAKLSGAETVIANDCDDVALDAARLNAELNRVEVATIVGDLTLAPQTITARHVLIACEMFYERTLATRLCSFLSSACARGATVLVADGERAFLPRSQLDLMCERNMPVDQRLEGVSQRRVGVYRWREP
jgi:predicted nicotinamide N-methyase